MTLQLLHTYSSIPYWVTVGHTRRKLVFIHLAPDNTGDDSEIVAIENRAHRREYADEELLIITISIDCHEDSRSLIGYLYLIGMG